MMCHRDLLHVCSAVFMTVIRARSSRMPDQRGSPLTLEPWPYIAGEGTARRYLGLEGGAALSVMRAIKQALDPAGIMNPGKKVPAG